MVTLGVLAFGVFAVFAGALVYVVMELDPTR